MGSGRSKSQVVPLTHWKRTSSVAVDITQLDVLDAWSNRLLPKYVSRIPQKHITVCDYYSVSNFPQSCGTELVLTNWTDLKLEVQVYAYSIPSISNLKEHAHWYVRNVGAESLHSFRLQIYWAPLNEKCLLLGEMNCSCLPVRQAVTLSVPYKSFWHLLENDAFRLHIRIHCAVPDMERPLLPLAPQKSDFFLDKLSSDVTLITNGASRISSKQTQTLLFVNKNTSSSSSSSLQSYEIKSSPRNLDDENGLRLPAHRLILAERSPVFRSMWFDSNLHECKTEVLDLRTEKRFGSTTWMQFLVFLYDRSFTRTEFPEWFQDIYWHPESFGDWWKLYEIAQCYKVESLLEECRCYFLQTPITESCLPFALESIRTYNDPLLRFRLQKVYLEKDRLLEAGITEADIYDISQLHKEDIRHERMPRFLSRKQTVSKDKPRDENDKSSLYLQPFTKNLKGCYVDQLMTLGGFYSYKECKNELLLEFSPSRENLYSQISSIFPFLSPKIDVTDFNHESDEKVDQIK